MTGTARLVQRTFFAPPRDLEPEGLYVETECGVVVAERARLRVQPNARVTTNTYFGRFPASYWQRWTPVERVYVRVMAQGEGRIRLMASDSDGRPRAVDSVRVPSAGPCELQAGLDQFADGGALWLEFTTGTEPLIAGEVRWEVVAPADERGAVVAICTYNRADECVATLRTLAADAECVAGLDAVYVVDQGSDPVSSRPGFAEVGDALGEVLRYVRQPNLGGAGGFTRGMVEATSGDPGTWPYVLLMDDDIVPEPDTVLRMLAFATSTAKPAIVGGQMLQLLHPARLHVGAEGTDLARLRAGRAVPEAVRDADMTSTRQEIRVDAEYNAWWSCVIPPQVLAGVGYPLPMFFQWDDIEYGLRARDAGFATVTLAGAGVWHADFSWKDWDDWSRYFSLRNALVVSALHGEFAIAGTAWFLFGELWRYLSSMRYGLARTLISAVEDFLRGPDVLADGGVQAAAAIRKLRADYPETVVHPSYGAPVLPVQVPEPTPSKPNLVLAKRAVYQVLGRTRGPATIAARHNHWWHVSLYGKAVVTDPAQNGVRLRERDPVALRALASRGTRVLVRFLREGRRAGHRYRAALPDLVTRENWTRLFGNE
ncbi:glycosyltransferase [Amycolatopsis alkalitolerans]|uniref:Glycosyltransferase family 2 protein n=1 Tax=Amycolatopsis alkalitolerans TaxID=2547244 RepID=A0A5C4LV09_9PSEU|nr:glycosyltransferase [Amycolatopsis alkalitolerans]TNC21824.1 glycosyltransferase family 2 protein [Amycolatopsis alkalitolerans]